MKDQSRSQGRGVPVSGSASAWDLDAAWVERIQRKLGEWYAGSHRALPWRDDRDPYRILVAETMLVQTTVVAVIPYFARFLARFPNVAALAEADEADVVKAWEGLGYYRRARQLHAAARMVLRDHEGIIPDDPEAIRALPGVGRYIAGALLSFAFDRPAAIVEANTQRVLARWLALPGDLKASATQARLWEAAGRLVPTVGAGAFNQAFMELGALVCIPRTPSCLVCPVSAECQARALGLQDVLPLTTPKPPPLSSAEASALVFDGGRILVVQRPHEGLWAGFWEFPTVHVSGADPAGRAFADGPIGLAEGVLRQTGVRARIGRLAKTMTYSVTKHRVSLEAYQATGSSDEPRPGRGFQRAVWERPENLAGLTFSSSGRRLVGVIVGKLRDATDGGSG